MADAEHPDAGASPRNGAPPAPSVLFRPGEPPPAGDLAEPDVFGDLNLDQALEYLLQGRESYQLEAFFYAPLHDVDAVDYRHEVFRDLERDEVREPVRRFVGEMWRMRDHLAQLEELHYERQQRAWFLDAVEIYCVAVHALADELARLDLGSRALRDLRAYVARYVAGESFATLEAETQALRQAFDGLRYTVRVRGNQVTVARHEGEPDYGAEVEETFARFRQGAVKSYLVRVRETSGMDHVEAQILDRVARLFPEPFAQLGEFCSRRRAFRDATVVRFDREVQFYLAYLELVRRLEAAGLAFCYPRVSTRSKQEAVEETFDLALATKLVPEQVAVVPNDYRLDGPERMLVVTGPNNGGKTTFARTFGQLHHLAALGLPVPGSRARLFLPDRIFCHFEREEDIETLRGKLDDELVRVHEILQQATSDSVLVLNESFGSTTLNDALFIGSDVIEQITALGALGVYVTFVDELASLNEATVSMVATIVPDHPAERTFRLVRRPADGLAYAWALADSYGLGYERLLERIAP